MFSFKFCCNRLCRTFSGQISGSKILCDKTGSHSHTRLSAAGTGFHGFLLPAEKTKAAGPSLAPCRCLLSKPYANLFAQGKTCTGCRSTLYMHIIMPSRRSKQIMTASPFESISVSMELVYPVCTLAVKCSTEFFGIFEKRPDNSLGSPKRQAVAPAFCRPDVCVLAQGIEKLVPLQIRPHF